MDVVLSAIGFVRGGRADPIDDHWAEEIMSSYW
jgi:hypothetical protein